MKIMTFHLPGGVYAVDLSAVASVARARGAAVALPSAGGQGPTSGGEADSIPVIDLADRLGLGGGTEEDAPAVVLRGAQGSAGVRVERLGEVVEVEGLRRLPRYFAHPLLRGVAEVGVGLVVVLDAEGLVAGARSAAGGAGEGA